MNTAIITPSRETFFTEFRRKMRDLEALSASMERILHNLRFCGRLSIVVEHGRVTKCGYEERYFTCKEDTRV